MLPPVPSHHGPEAAKKGLSSTPMALDRLEAGPGRSSSSDTTPLGLKNSISQLSTQSVNMDLNHRYALQRPSPPAPKYPKIQPAIAIKPRPIAVMPKPATQNASPVTLAAANYPSLEQAKAPLENPLNINTSKKWVLPPRPRPGRKPLAFSAENEPGTLPFTPLPSASSQSKSGKVSPKKKPKTYKKDEKSVPQKSCSALEALKSHPYNTHIPTPSHLQSLGAKETSVSPGVEPKMQDSRPIQALDSQVMYLARLKEQELIRNYIEALNNQIKELRFVQSGVISVDALDGNNTKQEMPSEGSSQSAAFRTPLQHGNSTQPPVQQLEKINNMNDLNKFLSYVNKLTSIIHSVTKKFIGDAKDLQSINTQIQHYLEIRSKYKLIKSQEMKSFEKMRKNSMSSVGIAKKGMKTPAPSSILISPNNSLNSTPGTGGIEFEEFDIDDSLDIPRNVSLQSHLLRPMNEFEFEDGDLFGVQNDRDSFLNDKAFIEKVSLPAPEATSQTRRNPELEKITKIKPESVDMPKVPLTAEKEPKKSKKKFNCGFCTNDTPCLCLDAEIGSLK